MSHNHEADTYIGCTSVTKGRFVLFALTHLCFYYMFILICIQNRFQNCKRTGKIGYIKKSLGQEKEVLLGSHSFTGCG